MGVILMNNNINNKFAFPFIWEGPNNIHNQTGLTIRQYYAAAAMQAFLSNPRITELLEKEIKSMVKKSFTVADAMIEAENGK
jgi:hypothetical protein